MLKEHLNIPTQETTNRILRLIPGALDSTKSSSERIEIIAEFLQKIGDHKATAEFCAYMLLANENLLQAIKPSIDHLADLFEESHRVNEHIYSTQSKTSKIAEKYIVGTIKRIKISSSRGKAAAESLHGRAGGSREKRNKIIKIWLSGKYSSRDICAEQECAALGMSFSTARKALRGIPPPKSPQ